MLIQAIEDNAAQLLLRMGTAGGGVLRDDAMVRWTIGGSPLDYHNAVVAADLTAENADAVIAESRELMKAHGVPGCWHVGPSARPADLGERLLRAGFTDGGREPAMAVEIAKLSTARLGPPGLEITRVTTDEELAVWEQTLGRGFGEGPLEAAWVAEIYRREGYADPWRHYLARLDGEPVATATIFLTEDVAGVYFVMTVPEARRQGIGAAITQHAVRAAGEDDAASPSDAPSASRTAAASGAASTSPTAGEADTASPSHAASTSRTVGASDTASPSRTVGASDAASASGPADASGAACEDGPRQRRGAARYAVLEASSAGRSVYAELGFEELAGIELYEFH